MFFELIQLLQNMTTTYSSSFGWSTDSPLFPMESFPSSGLSFAGTFARTSTLLDAKKMPLVSSFFLFLLRLCWFCRISIPSWWIFLSLLRCRRGRFVPVFSDHNGSRRPLNSFKRPLWEFFIFCDCDSTTNLHHHCPTESQILPSQGTKGKNLLPRRCSPQSCWKSIKDSSTPGWIACKLIFCGNFHEEGPSLLLFLLLVIKLPIPTFLWKVGSEPFLA